MCGIVGIFSYKSRAPSADINAIRHMRDLMYSRGPDSEGLWASSDHRVVLGHRRLAIIDLEARAAQPFASVDGQWQIVFNGEIYNYQALRQKLIAKGYSFRTTSDTEALLYLFQEMGPACLSELRGMYAFAIWNQHDQTLFLARDPFGIKPLYYLDTGEQFYFASQVKALKQAPVFSSDLSAAGQVGFFLLGYVPEPFTIYEKIQALPAGHFLTVQYDKSPRKTAFFDFRETLQNAQLTLKKESFSSENLTTEIHRYLLESVQAHLVSDVPVGLFLSAGIDSTALLSLMQELHQPQVQSMTLGFKEFVSTPQDEVPLASLAAKHFQSTHSVNWVGQMDFENLLTDFFNAMDQPSIDGMNTFLVSRVAAQQGLKVVLSGLGGDELFGGYPSFRQIPNVLAITKCLFGLSTFGRGFRYLTAPYMKYLTNPKYASLFEYGHSLEGLYFLRRGLFMPWELPQVLAPEIVQQGWQDLNLFSRFSETISVQSSLPLSIGLLEIIWYMRNQLLRDTDWASMAHSLEVRTPFVDIVLYQQLLPLLLNEGCLNKKLMIQGLSNPLPNEIIRRKKTGFVVPVLQWFKKAFPNEAKQHAWRGFASFVFKQYIKAA